MSAITIMDQYKPAYNHNHFNTLKVCKLNLNICKEFYKGIYSSKSAEKICPFGFTVCKKTFDISTKQNKISIYSIVEYSADSSNYDQFNELPREKKKSKDEALAELSKYNIDNNDGRKQYQYLCDLLETLLVGRIGISIQGLSHQFFTPLQGAMSDIENIKSNSDIENSIARLTKNFNSLNKLATEVQLLLSSSEQFNYKMLRRVAVHKMVADIFESLESTAHQKHLVLQQGFNRHTTTVHAIPGQLYIVMCNIINNAIKYSFNGFPMNPLAVDIEYSDYNNEFLIIEIRNEGCKITHEEIRDKLLFDLGYRGEYSRDRQRKGTGTGLYIASEITGIHKGTIDVSSTLIGGNLAEGTDRYLNSFLIYWPYYISEE
jgi:signal transduction histidine kinase